MEGLPPFLLLEETKNPSATLNKSCNKKQSSFTPVPLLHFFVVIFFSRNEEKRRRHSKKKKKTLFLFYSILFERETMDAVAAAAGGSAPRLRVDELLDDVANSVRDNAKKMTFCADCSRRRRRSSFVVFMWLSGRAFLSLCSFLVRKHEFQTSLKQRAKEKNKSHNANCLTRQCRS